ncbi:hypothetical protein ACQ4LD_21015, partial [Sphingobacterium daejeonense]
CIRDRGIMEYYNQDTLIYLNGEFVKANNAGVDMFGQSLHYGYGAFEGLRAYSTHNLSLIHTPSPRDRILWLLRRQRERCIRYRFLH